MQTFQFAVRPRVFTLSDPGKSEKMRAYRPLNLFEMNAQSEDDVDLSLKLLARHSVIDMRTFSAVFVGAIVANFAAQTA
ncbi:hypothetical protein Apmu_0637_03 [Acidiphilium multivorum AIU301]|uniref:hypothetical protein n=1 Tax=Acidiphilium multivorum TaxID=62140 RepID=UPI0005E7AB8D|nr:hypothetical protein [Acidiphilium multivorum]GAN75727.1 hypothetical protein Apmu_0637_03 [Acidiphilium multivorum AIU301]